MNLGLNLRPGKAAKQSLPTVLNVRALESDEVAAHSQARAGGEALTPLQRLTSRHRQMARMLASGASPGEVAMSMGFTTARVWQLRQDPTFADLVRHYELEIESKFVGFSESLSGLAEDSVEELRERLETAPDSFEVSELMAIARLGADRTGYGPSRSETHNINVNFGDRLEEARKRAHSAKDKLIEADDAEFTEVNPDPDPE